VIVDFLWGDLAAAAMNNAKTGTRHIQGGNSAGPTSMIRASVIRNNLVKLLGQGMTAAPADVRRSDYAQLVRHTPSTGSSPWTWRPHDCRTSARPGSV
jgi:hypothetical protein